jgi:hypothetical protein
MVVGTECQRRIVKGSNGKQVIKMATHFCVALVMSLITNVNMYPAVTVSAAQTGTEWQRYIVNGEEFSVLLPFASAMTTNEVYLDRNQERRERILGAYGDGVAYAIYTFEKKSLSMDDLVRRFAANQQTEDITVNSIEGRRSTFENDDRIAITQVFATARNLYVFVTVGSKLRDPSVNLY